MTFSLFEDFVESNDMLQVVSGSSGSQSRLDKPGGVLEITTGSAQNNIRALETVTQFVNVARRPAFGGKVKLGQTQNAYFFLGLSEIGSGLQSADRYCGMWTGAGVQTWRGVSKESPNNTYVNLPIPETVSEMDLMVETDPKMLRFYINGALVGTITQETAIPTAGLMKLIIFLKTTEAAAKTVEVDYVWLSAAR